MTTFDYTRSRATADRLIARFGQAGTLSRPTKSGTPYNPTPGAPDDHPCTFVVLEYAQGEIDGSRVLETDKKVMLCKGALAIEPATSDKLLVGGVSHSIMDVRPLSPGGTVVLFEIQVRR